MSASTSGCLGCDRKHKLIPSIDESVKGQQSQTQAVSKTYISEGIYASSTCDMDHNAVHSHGSVSSINKLSQTLDSHGTGNTAQEFTNHGFLLWNQSRQRWIGNKRKSENQGDQLREPSLSWNATYDSLLGSNKPFAKPVPLSEMVDFLVDVWEQEGMYD